MLSFLRLCVISQDLFIAFKPNLWNSSKSTLLKAFCPSYGGFALWLKGHGCFLPFGEWSDVLHFAVVCISSLLSSSQDVARLKNATAPRFCLDFISLKLPLSICWDSHCFVVCIGAIWTFFLGCAGWGGWHYQQLYFVETLIFTDACSAPLVLTRLRSSISVIVIWYVIVDFVE